MNDAVSSQICSFCGEPGGPERVLACRLGATICPSCLVALADDGAADDVERSLTDAELLARLPQILTIARQVDEFAARNVALLRQRKVTWTEIGQVLGVSRQAAWERYAKRVAPPSGP